MAPPILLAALATALALPQQPLLTGAVIDAFDGSAVPAARIALVREGVATQSDESGRFTLGTSLTDTLVVTHPEYVTTRFLIMNPLSLPNLRIALTPHAEDGSDTLRVALDVAAMAELTNGMTWGRGEFWRHTFDVVHPFHLLLFSGLVASIDESLPGMCVRLVGAPACATIWVNGEPGIPLPERDPVDVEAFVVSMPGASSGEFRSPNGIIGIFFVDRSP